jgi:hypothetical protein
MMQDRDEVILQLRAELEGKRARDRYLMRQRCLSAQANIQCPCGQIIQTVEGLDAHLDHMIEADAAAEERP